MHNTAQYAQLVLNASVSHQAAQARTLSGLYSRTQLNGHPSIADTHDITDNSEKSWLSSYSLQCLSNPWIADTPLATPYNRQLSWSQLNTSKSNQLGTFGLVSRFFTLFYWPHIIDQSAAIWNLSCYCSSGGDASGMGDIEASKTSEETFKSPAVMVTSNGLCPSCSSLCVQRLRSLQR